MSNTDIRQQAKEYVEQLSPEKLLVAVDFLAYLVQRESNEATEELLQIPGFQEAFTKAKKNIAAGKVIPVDQLKRKY